MGHAGQRRSQRLAMLRHQFPRQFNSRAHANLLPQHRTNRQLQAIPRPRHPQPRALGNQPRHQGINRQFPMNRCQVRIQIKHPPQPRGDLRHGR